MSKPANANAITEASIGCFFIIGQAATIVTSKAMKADNPKKGWIFKPITDRASMARGAINDLLFFCLIERLLIRYKKSGSESKNKLCGLETSTSSTTTGNDKNKRMGR